MAARGHRWRHGVVGERVSRSIRYRQRQRQLSRNASKKRSK